MQMIRDGSRGTFDLDEFLSRPLFAHLATASEHGPRESPVWFSWEEGAFWIMGDGGDTFPKRVEEEPRCAVGIVDFDPNTGLVRHAGFRGRATVRPYDRDRVGRLFSRYLGGEKAGWDDEFHDALDDTSLVFVRFEPETVVVRDQSYKVTSRPTSADTDRSSKKQPGN